MRRSVYRSCLDWAKKFFDILEGMFCIFIWMKNSITLRETKELLSEFLKNEDAETKQAAIIFLYGSVNGVHSPFRLSYLLGYELSSTVRICSNLIKNKIWSYGICYADLDNKDVLMEILLCAMAGLGILVRKEDKYDLKRNDGSNITPKKKKRKKAA